VACFVVAALIPEDALSAGEALPASIAVMVCGLLGAGWLARRLMPGAGMRRVAAWVLVLAAVKLGSGLWYWDEYMYSLSDQHPRSSFTTSDIYYERASDTAVIDELLILFRFDGIRFYSSADAYLSINNRVPAHLTALLVRAFGGQYAGSFPIVAMFAGFASLALAAASVVRVPLHNRRIAIALAVAWPAGWVVCSVMKDPMLFAFSTMIAAYLSLSSGNRDTAIGLALATAVLPMFRPAYIAACGALLIVWFVRSRARLAIKAVGVAGTAAIGLVLAPFIQAQDRMGGYLQMTENASPVMQVPVVGRIVYGLMTPFPWTHFLDDWTTAPYGFVAATAVITVASLFMIVRRRARALWYQVDYGAALAAGMVIGGIASPQIAPWYVQVGAAGLMPFALRTPLHFHRVILLSLAGFVLANVVWILAR
jgi:hypothetical protein